MFENKVNNLSGKEWLRHSINFWNVETSDLNAIFNEFYSYCYKDRTGSGLTKNIDKYEIKRTDFSFNYIKTINDIYSAISCCLNGAFNSYHVFIFDKEIINKIFITKTFTNYFNNTKIEFRGKIILSNKKQIIYYALVFLNRSTDEINKEINLFKLGRYDLSFNYVIDSKSKIDEIGLKHPAPFSYIDIEKIVEVDNINNCTILDPFLGVGSTIIGTYKNNNFIYGFELNPEYVELSYKRFKNLQIENELKNKYQIFCGDALKLIDNTEIVFDTIITSPPYCNILKNKTTGVRTDKSQSRQGIEFYSENKADLGNIENYDEYLKSLVIFFNKAKSHFRKSGSLYLVISDFTFNKKEKDVHSDIITLLSQIGYIYAGTSIILQNQKAIYPFGYPFKIVLNHIFQYIIKFEVNNEY